jgi:hypothetical protein
VSRSLPANGRYEIAHPNIEIIPAIPWGRIDQPFMGRESVMRSEHVCDDSPRVICDPYRYFDSRNGEMWCHCFCNLPTQAQVNGALAECRKIADVKAICLTICPRVYQENYLVFAHQGYERQMARERGQWFVLVKSQAEQWK